MERAQRLRKGEPFDLVFRVGTAVGGPFFVVRHRANGETVTRWGFAVGKRIARKATVRNRTRRRLRAAVDELNVAGGHDVVVIARERALTAPFGELQAALAKQVGRAGLLAPPPGEAAE